MANTGTGDFYYAKYKTDSSGIVTYSDGGLFGKSIEFTADFGSAQQNILYASNAPAEVDNFFAGGTINVTTDEILSKASKDISGAKSATRTVDGEPVEELIFDDENSPPDLGFGVIIEKVKNGVKSYRAIVFLKIKFNVPPDSARTRGERIEWQTPAISGTIMRDDTNLHGWKVEATVPTLEQAVKYVKAVLNIPVIPEI